MAERDDYALVSAQVTEVPAPDLPYLPPRPEGRHRIALVGKCLIDAFLNKG